MGRCIKELIAFFFSTLILFLSLSGLIYHIQSSKNDQKKNICSNVYNSMQLNIPKESSLNEMPRYRQSFGTELLGIDDNILEKLTILDLFLIMVTWCSAIFFTFFYKMLSK